MENHRHSDGSVFIAVRWVVRVVPPHSTIEVAEFIASFTDSHHARS